MTSPTTIYRGRFFINEDLRAEQCAGLCEYLCDGRVKHRIKATGKIASYNTLNLCNRLKK